jgi:hypothetical protein
LPQSGSVGLQIETERPKMTEIENEAAAENGATDKKPELTTTELKIIRQVPAFQ